MTTINSLSAYIDHTNLKPDAQPEDIVRLCQEAMQYGFKSCCVNSLYVPLVKKTLGNSGVLTCAVVGFPLGASATPIKAAEAAWCIDQGADEIDMVIAIGLLKAGEDDLVREDIAAVKNAVSAHTLKVIIETCLLTPDEIRRACVLAVEAGADFVKTSTGFSTGGAKASDVRLMKETVGAKAEVKASGGIHHRQEALAMIDAGASRIGASSGITICTED